MTLTRETLIRGLKNVLTLALAALAALVLWHLYDYYTYAPQTRDGKLRADVVPLAAAVSGRGDSVAIHAGQVVGTGALLEIGSAWGRERGCQSVWIMVG